MKFNLFVRHLRMVDDLRNLLESKITTENESVPGQIRKKDDWYFLTYMRIVKIKNFDSVVWDLTQNEINTVRAVRFKLTNNRLFVNGQKSEIIEILNYFDALSLVLGGSEAEENPAEFDFSKYYKVEEPTVDFENILKHFEDSGALDSISKIKIPKAEVSLGDIKSPTVSTHNYDSARNAIVEQNERDLKAVEYKLKLGEKVTIYFDVDGQIRVNAGPDDDVDLVDLTLQYVELL